MRGTVSTVLSWVLLATAVAVGAAGAASAPPPGGEARRAAEPPQRVRAGVVVDLPEGDRFKVWHSRDLRTVWGQRYDAATSTWGGWTVVLRQRDLYCGAVDARSSAGAVAVTAQCDRGGYAEDQAPVSSHALYSPDTMSWTAHELEGEAHEEPGISPDGRAAVWPLHQGYVTWTAADGFVHRTIEAPEQEYTVTAAIADDGTVSYLFGASGGKPSCRTLVVLTRLGDAAPARQELRLDHACQDWGLANVDALTVWFGEMQAPESVTTIGRPDTRSGWAVTGTPPSEAPGLVVHSGRDGLDTRFFHSPGLPLVAMGSAGDGLDTQAYDAAAQRWEPVRRRYRGRTCQWADSLWWGDSLGVLAAPLRCDGRNHVMVSPDGRGWRSLALSRHPLGVSADLSLVAVTNRRRTYVVSQERGLVRLPVAATRRCDVVLPASPSTALRLTTARRDGWPNVLQESVGDRWRRTSARVPRPRTGKDRCRHAEVEIHDSVPVLEFLGQRRGAAYSVSPYRDGWTVRRGYR